MASFGSFLGSLAKGLQATVAHGDPNYYDDQAKKDQANALAYPNADAAYNAFTTNPATNPALPQPAAAAVVNPAASGGGGAGTPSITPYLGQVQGDQGNLNDLYSQLFGAVDSQVANQTGQLQNQYNQQFDTADKAFATNQAGTNNAMFARGAGDSSYNAAAQGANQDIYNQDHQNMVNAEQQGLANLGQYDQTAKAGFNADKAGTQVDLSQYTDVPSLQALHQQLGTHIAGLQQQLAGLGTNQSYLDTLNKITPIQSQAATQLSQKLANLVGSSASTQAKSALAQGYISEAGLTDPNAQNYWTSYFNDLTKKSPTAALQ